MTKIKKNIFFITKAASALVIFLTLVLFVYAAFFLDKYNIERKVVKNDGNVITFNIGEKWLDIGNLDDYEKASILIKLSNLLSVLFFSVLS